MLQSLLMGRAAATTIVFVFLALLAEAQISTLPQCALNCATRSAQAAGCQLTDVNCLCTSNPFLSTTERCAAQACSDVDRQQAAAVIASLCSAAIPPPATTNSSSSGSSTAPPSTVVTTIISTISASPTTVTSVMSSVVSPVVSDSVSTTSTSSVSSSSSSPSTSPTSTTSSTLSTRTSVVLVTASPTQPLPTLNTNAAWPISPLPALGQILLLGPAFIFGFFVV